MGDESKIRDAADAVKGVLEAVPVYQDLIQPTAKELGIALQKTIHIALSPLYLLVWGHEQISAYIGQTLPEKLKNVPEDQIVSPSAAVAGPTLEALRFAGQEPSLRDLYMNLLATSMDARTAEEAHPAFVEVIRQLSSDEARVLRFIACSYPSGLLLFYGSLYLVMQANDNESQSNRISRTKWISQLESDDIPCLDVDPSNTLARASKCEYPHLAESYLVNLRRLGILDVERGADSGLDLSHMEMKGEEYIWGAIHRYLQEIGLPEPGKVLFQGSTDIVRLTAFGESNSVTPVLLKARTRRNFVNRTRARKSTE